MFNVRLWRGEGVSICAIRPHICSKSYLLLRFVELLPLGTEQLADFTYQTARIGQHDKKGVHTSREKRTEASVRVLSLDPLAPVLTEEHVRRQRAFRALAILLALADTLFGLLCGLALSKKQVSK